MTSTKKISSNRTNARKSSGPRTATGKANSSRNALRHGLSSRDQSSKIDEGLIQRIIDVLTGNGQPNENLEACALEVALSLLEVSRVRAAKTQVWESLSRHHASPTRGLLSEDKKVLIYLRYDDTLSVFRKFQKSMPQMFKRSFEDADDMAAATCLETTGDLKKLIRYERRAINRRNRAICAFDAALLTLAKEN